MNNIPFIRHGWQCPICKTVYSPDTPVCFYCNPNSNETTTAGYKDYLDWRARDSITSGGR